LLIRAPMRAVAAALLLVACSTEPSIDDDLELSELDQATTVCGTSATTVKGIDVSYYQGTIDWARVKTAGVKYAFIRVSDGLATIDTKFDTYWAQSRANGIIHGAYQFFRPNQDPIAQADLFLEKIGNTIADDDLPPVLDVEAANGMTPAQIASKAKQWLDHVEAALGIKPIIYTGFYFWRDQVGAPAYGAQYPLWHAQYTSAACPNISAPWTAWAFWQYTSTGTVDGIAGNVDTNRFDGTMAQLMELTPGGGNGTNPPAPCGVIAADGGTIDDGDDCFVSGGPTTSMRQVTTAGEGGDLVWTHTTDHAEEANFGQWNLELAEAGHYKLEVYTAAAFAQSTRARYTIRANGAEQEVVLDQTATDGWQTLADLDFAAGGDQFVHLADNTGETLASNTQLVFDSVRLTRTDGEMPGETDPGDAPPEGTGCSSGKSSSLLLGLAVFGLRRRRRQPS
jgi:GH25 family lysozyme M1 (1,4-beta-N-acetylmuramidase)